MANQVSWAQHFRQLCTRVEALEEQVRGMTAQRHVDEPSGIPTSSTTKSLMPVIQGYTMEQWQFIIDGGFLCEFSDYPLEDVQKPFIGTISHIKTEDFRFVRRGTEGWRYCRPLRTKGVIQPWFGGECPVDPDAMVAVKNRRGNVAMGAAHHYEDNWRHKGTGGDIIEFIEL